MEMFLIHIIRNVSICGTVGKEMHSVLVAKPRDDISRGDYGKC